MVALFADLPEAVANTVEIARRCAFRPKKRKPILPRFAEDEVEELRRQARAGLDARLAVIPHSAPAETYRERLEFELGVIEGMGFPGYFLIVADFIKWAKAHDIPVGPGRGSGAGSLVAYALTITDLDPLRYGLLFERFLNPDRISMPDFDIDFCMDRREEVIAYVQERYGRERVAQIITFGALLSKAAVRDVGRVLQMPYGQVDRLSKLIPVEGVKPVSIDKALADEPRLREEARRDPQVARLLDDLRPDRGPAAQRLHPRRRRRHRRPPARGAGAALPRPALGHAGDPVQHEVGRGSGPGEVRLPRPQDPHRHPQRARPPQGPRRRPIDIGAIPLDDAKTYEVYASAQTVAVFQVESTGMRTALRQLKPTCIEDIIALVALYRPGPMENIPKFCNVKNGREPRESLHPSIDPILDETQGIIVYQEQVMEIARKLAGFSLGGADLLRRAMGKKIQAEMDAQKPLFIEGAKANGVSKAKADEVWNLLDKFANYGFNKSHAAAYAVVSYQTAWLKANHPVEFMAAVMNCDIHLTDKLGPYKQEVDRLGIEVVPPCVNRSGATFGVEDGRILYALGALKNVGVDAMRLIADDAAPHGGRFDGLFDFAARVDLRRVGKRALEMLARAGALDALDSNRRKVFETLEALMAWSGAVHDDRASRAGQPVRRGDRPRCRRRACRSPTTGRPWSAWPRSTPPSASTSPATRSTTTPGRCAASASSPTPSSLRKAAGAPVTIAQVAGTVAALDQRKSARGTRFAFVRLSDPTGLFEVRMFSDVLDVARDHLEPGMSVVLTVEATLEGDELKLLAKAAQPIDAAVAGAASTGLRVFLDDARRRRLARRPPRHRRPRGPQPPPRPDQPRR